MKGTPIDELVFGYLFPGRTGRDPTNFAHYVQRHLVPEVRREVLSYFGHLDTDEARYPGLDYTNRIHRVRLSRWRHHRDLFNVFDVLRLTSSEISDLTRWEGTKWAKDNHETRRREPIPNTAADHMPHWGYGDARPTSRITGRPVPPRTLRPAKERFAGIAEDAEYEISRASRTAPRHGNASAFASEGPDSCYAKNDAAADAMDMYVVEDDEVEGDDGDETEAEEDKEEDEVMASVGVPLNQHLRTQAARRNAGDTNVVMDAEWEAWFAYFKSSLEPPSPLGSPTYMAAAAAAAAAASAAPDCPAPPHAPSASQATPRSLLRQQQQQRQQQQRQQQQRQQQQHFHHHLHRMLEPIAPQMLAAARAGRWHEIPPHRQAVLRQLLGEQQHRQWPEPDELVRVPARA